MENLDTPPQTHETNVRRAQRFAEITRSMVQAVRVRFGLRTAGASMAGNPDLNPVEGEGPDAWHY